MPRAIGSWDGQRVQLIKRYRALGQVLVGSSLKHFLGRPFEQAHRGVRWGGTEAHASDTKPLQLTNWRQTLSHHNIGRKVQGLHKFRDGSRVHETHRVDAISPRIPVGGRSTNRLLESRSFVTLSKSQRVGPCINYERNPCGLA